MKQEHRHRKEKVESDGDSAEEKYQGSNVEKVFLDIVDEFNKGTSVRLEMC